MLKKLRIGPKLLLAPGIVLILLVALTACAWFGMVRQNASMENLVQVRAERLKAAADVSGEARYAHAHIYQLLAWVNGSVAPARLEALGKQIKARHTGIEAQLRKLAAKKGSGWVDYQYKNPTTGKIEPKTTYILRVGDAVLEAGIYKK